MRLPRLSLLTVVLLLAGASTAVAASVGVVTGLLATSTKTLTRVTCTVTGALNDTYVSQSSPTSTTGATATSLSVSITYSTSGKTTTITRARALVSFSLSSCPATIQQNAQVDSATLKLYVSSAPSTARTLGVFQVTSSWDNTATWNLQPTYAASAESTFSASAATVGWASIDVTGDLNNYIQTNPTVYPPYSSAATWYGWMIGDDGATTGLTTITSTNSGTTSQRPQLVVTYVY